jgi:AraC-like DNA-binding protein
MTGQTTSDPAIPLSEGDIEATNVLPALDTSLRFGLSEEELFAEVGWRRADLTRPHARVTGESTYKHLELMYARPRYAEFVLAAAIAHDSASLGIVGLACKTVPDVRSAIACHERYQHITNRTARYHTAHEGAWLHLREERPGPRRLGSLLMSEYTLFVAVRLLSSIADGSELPLVRVRAMKCRRAEIPEAELERYSAFLGVVPEVGASVAELTFDAEVVNAKVKRADPELEAYFRSVLDRAMPEPSREPTVVHDVRITIRERLLRGTPTVNAVARALGVGSRTLQRRLAEHGLTFADVLEDTRRAAAEGYLRTSSLTLSEIAYLLGYGEQASFFRAFRRWHDTTPDAYRRARLTRHRRG